MGRKIGIALAFMIILCTIVGFGASAEGAINLGGDGCDQLTYVGKLNDGRVVFCGSVGSIGDYHNSRARLLCLNPDWTVSWEYIDPAEGEARYIYGAILQDDIIRRHLSSLRGR